MKPEMTPIAPEAPSAPPLNRRSFLSLCAAGVAGLAVRAGAAEPARQPLNVIWIMADDAGPAFGCYGQDQIHTPNVDRLAREGVRYSRAFSTAPVCSPSRSAMAPPMSE